MGTRLAGKVAIITGATLGLGKAAALLFAKEGASVVICDRGRTPENAQRVLAEAEGLSGEIAYKTCDVMKKEDITALVEFTLERYGRVDVMANNAIIDNPGGLLENVALEDWEDGLFCHLTAPLLFCKEVVPSMVEQGGGSIINVSSGSALFGGPSISSYGPAKAGMINFTMSLAVTYGPYGIRANTVTPARMLTEKNSKCSRVIRQRSEGRNMSIPWAVPPSRNRWLRSCSFSLPMRQQPSPGTTWSRIEGLRHSILSLCLDDWKRISETSWKLKDRNG